MRRLAAALLALLLLAGGPAPSRGEDAAFLVRAEKDGARVTARLSLTALPALSGSSLAAVNGWLDRLTLTAAVCGRDEEIRMELDGEPVFSALVRTDPEGTLTVFGPEGGAYLTAPGERNALELLAGGGAWMPSEKAAAAWPAVAERLFGVLARHAAPKLTRERTSIRNADPSTAYELYLFPRDTLTKDIWTEALEAALPALRGALEELPGAYRQAEEMLRGIEFSGECRIKRYLDRDGGDLGMQWTCRAGRGGDVRKVTLYFAYTPGKGGYLSLKAPAARGGNDAHLTLDYRKTAERNAEGFAFSWNYAWKKDGAEKSGRGSVSLRIARAADREEWTGKASIRMTEGGRTAVWTLTPALTAEGNGLQGAVKLRLEENGRETLKGEIALRAETGAEIASAVVPVARDLRQSEDSAARAAVQAEWLSLTGTAARLMKELPAETRNHLLHELRTDAWMNGPAVPPPEDNWTVWEEEAAE